MPFAAIVLACTVFAVADGDTMRARCATSSGEQTWRIRTAGIDAPERGQPFGHAARASLRERALGKLVQAGRYKMDRYERHACRVNLGEADLGLQQVRDGLAWRYVAFEREQTDGERSAYSDAEATARAQRRGLWQDETPLAPWEWRASH